MNVTKQRKLEDLIYTFEIAINGRYSGMSTEDDVDAARDAIMKLFGNKKVKNDKIRRDT